ncbi:MAG: dynamin family protein [Halothiobacillaceae bacterium]
MLDQDHSFVTQIQWWPMIACLGTFSAGKSTFINDYLGCKVQATGNQAVDDRFTVICSGPDSDARVLPGRALDADPRFPFYQISLDLETVGAGEGKRIDRYLQLKSVKVDRLKGRILIDSPGFDADVTRSGILKISQLIIDRADLVLVFFDARHAEPGAMQETLRHLVAGTVNRPDANKFLFILNQIDATSHEDNLEEVTGAWQRAVATHGLNSGQFFLIYSEDAATSFESEDQHNRYRRKRDRDLEGITKRIDKVTVERTYRVVGNLEVIADRMLEHWLPTLSGFIRRWRRAVLLSDIAAIVIVIAAAAYLFIRNFVHRGHLVAPLGQIIADHRPALAIIAGAIAVFLIAVHMYAKNAASRRLVKRIPIDPMVDLRAAFRKHTAHWLVPLWRQHPVGWRGSMKQRLDTVKRAARDLVRQTNDLYARPSGGEPLFADATSRPSRSVETPAG